MAATIQAKISTSSGPTNANAETGITFSKDDAATGTTPVQIPTSTGTNYSYYKFLYLDVTSGASTSMSNRRVYLSGSPTTGLHLYFKAAASYTQPTGGNTGPADSTSTNNDTPATFTEVTATTLGGAHVWDSGSDSVSSTGRSGDYLQLVFGVGSNYSGGAGSATALPDIKMAYDEQ